MSKKKLNLEGQVFGKLTVIQEAEPVFSPGGHKSSRWLCKCECENEAIVRTTSLTSGKAKSCGCLRIEKVKERSITHSKSYTGEYRVWASMIQRCCNPNSQYYDIYGGKGITVCDEWKDNFQAFYDYIGPAPCKEASIDRIDSNGNYEPGNVRWAINPSIQPINQGIRKDNSSGVKGVYWFKRTGKWYASISTNKKTIHLGYFDNKEAAIQARLQAEKIYHAPLLN